MSYAQARSLSFKRTVTIYRLIDLLDTAIENNSWIDWSKDYLTRWTADWRIDICSPASDHKASTAVTTTIAAAAAALPTQYNKYYSYCCRARAMTWYLIQRAQRDRSRIIFKSRREQRGTTADGEGCPYHTIILYDVSDVNPARRPLRIAFSHHQRKRRRLFSVLRLFRLVRYQLTRFSFALLVPRAILWHCVPVNLS